MTTVLAVDDSVTMRKVLEITFGGDQYQAVIAGTAGEALSLLRSERPALLVTDHTLPDMSGYDLAREAKTASPGTAVLVLSSKQSPYDKARGAASGVDDFMDKPFDTQKLLDKVAQVLAAPRVQVAAPAPAPAPVAAAAPAKPRPQTLSYGTPAPGAATPKPASVAAPRPVAPAAQPAPRAAAPAAPTPAAARPVAPAAAVAAAVSPELGGKLQALGLTPVQVEGVLALSREVVERVVWEVVPVLAETLIKEEIRRLTAE